MEFAEGVATGVLTLVGSTVGTTAGAISKITGVIGQSLATLTFDEEYQNARIRDREPATNAVTHIATGGKNVFMVSFQLTNKKSSSVGVSQGFFNGITGIVTQPISGAIHGGAAGFAGGVGKGLMGVVTKPTGAVVDFASTSLDAIKR
jgi:vacuolar protein sorting-associated protein 13A/C